MRYLSIVLLFLLSGCFTEDKPKVLSESDLQKAKVYRSLEEIETSDSVYILMLHPFSFDELPKTILDLKNLQWLSLNYGKLSNLKDSDIKALPSLQKLNLNHNPLTSLPEKIDDLKFLRLLNVSHTQIKALPNNLSKIESLDKIYVGMTDIPVTELKAFKIKRPDVQIMLEYAVEYDTTMTEESITELYDEIISDM